MLPFERDASRARSTSEPAGLTRPVKALMRSLGLGLAVISAMAVGLFVPRVSEAGPIALSIRVQKEFYKAQAVVTSRVVPCFKTDPNTGVQTMGLCTETVTETPAVRAPANIPPPPPPARSAKPPTRR
jgi:hypothetical protein